MKTAYLIHLSSAAAICGLITILVGFPLVYMLRFIGPSLFSKVGFTHIVLMALIFSAPAAIRKIRYLYLHEIMFLLWILTASVMIVFYILLGYPTHSTATQILGFSQAIMLMIIFRSVPRQGTAVLFAAIFSIIFSFAAVFSVPHVLDSESFFLVSYQTVGVVIFISGYYIVSIARPWVSIIFSLIAAITLFQNGARTEFAIFILLFTGGISTRHPRVGILLVPTLFLIVFLISINIAKIAGTYELSRTVGIFNITSDESYLARKGINAAALDTISNNPIFGSYNSYQSGNYSHNFLSAWVDFGIAGFIIYLTSAATLIFKALTIKRPDGSRDYVLILLSACFFISIVSAKAYFHPLIGVIVGVISSRISESKARRRVYNAN